MTNEAMKSEQQQRLVRNLLALRMRVSVEQMQSGKWNDDLRAIDDTLAGLGHDMKSVAARAADAIRRAALVPRLARARHAARPARR